MEQKSQNRIEYYTVVFRTFRKGALHNPRLEPNAEWDIFVDENGKFDALSFQSAIMLFNLLNMLKDKISKFYIPH